MAIFAGGCLTVTHDSEELTIISFFARENLLCQKHNNFLKLLFTQTSNKDIGMISFSFFSFVFNAAFNTKRCTVHSK